MKEPDEIFKKHFEQFRHGLTSASLKYYLEKGSVSGSLLLGVRAMFKDWDEQNSHKHSVMQAEASGGVSGAAVGQRSVGKTVSDGKCYSCGNTTTSKDNLCYNCKRG
jgi:hypothetical protein